MDNNTPVRPAVYARVSTTEQARPDATSLETQLERATRYAESQGWDVVEEFTDPGHSGNSRLADRSGGAALLAAVKAGEVDAVVFWSMDRFTRSATKGLVDIQMLEDMGVSLVFVKEAIDTRTASGRLFRTMLAAFSEFERETIRDRNLSGQAKKASRGGWPTGQVVFGYRVSPDGDGLGVCEEEAVVIRRLFHLRAERMSGTAIAALLIAEGVLPPNVSRGHTRKAGPAPWSLSTVMRLIDSTVYRDGVIERRVGDEMFTFEVPPIVTAKEWGAAHKKLRGLSKVEGVGERRYKYPLSQRLFHDHSGLAQRYSNAGDRIGVVVEEKDQTPPHLMFGQMRPTGDGDLRYYRCNAARKNKGVRSFCPGLGKGPWGNGGRVTAVQADLVEARILLWMMELLDDPEVLEAYLATIDDGVSKVPPASLTDLRERLSSTHIQAEAIADTYLAGAFGDVGSAEARALRDSKLEPVVTLRARVEADMDRLEQEQAQEGIARVTIEDLLAWEIVDNGERDPNADEYSHGDGQSRDDLRRLALSILASETDRVGALSAEVVEEVARYVRVLDLSVVLTPNPDRPMWPNLRVKFDPEGLTSISSSVSRSGCRGGGGTGTRPASVRQRRNAARS